MSENTTLKVEEGVRDLKLQDTTMPERQIISKDGDLEISAANGDRFLVSSQILSSASQKLRSLLSGDSEFVKLWELARSNGDPSAAPLEIPANSAPLLTVLNALHHGKAREVLTLSELAEVALLVDMYDLQEALKRFITIWTDVWRTDDMDGLESKMLADWVAISFAFGLEEEFEIATRELIRFVKFDGDRDLYEDPELEGIPEKVMDRICELQRERLAKLVNYLNDESQKRISLGLGANCKSSSAPVPRALEDRKKCDSYQLGNLIYAMNSDNMPNLSQSIHEAVGNLEDIAELGTHNPEYNHDACSWNSQMREWLVDVEEEDLCLKLSTFPDRIPVIAVRNSIPEVTGDPMDDEEGLQ